MMNEEREILFGGYNARGEWVEGFACKNEFGDWLIIGPFMDEETDVEHVGNVYQYTGIDINGLRIFDRSRIEGTCEWVDSLGNTHCRSTYTTVEYFCGSWVLSDTKINLLDFISIDGLVWNVQVKLPKIK